MKKSMLLKVFVAFVFSLMTSQATDYFTEIFYGNFDLNGLSLTFTPDGSEDYYSASGKRITELPVDATTHNVLVLNDDDSRKINFGNGSFRLYGGARNYAVNIGSNGYLTFNEADTTFAASITNHFDTPRMSALYRDLNPSTGGSVRWGRESDPERFVVTFLAVPDFGSTPRLNTFQTELFFADGSIRMSWLGVAATSAIVGLSEGKGVPPEGSTQTDLSSLAWDLDDDKIPNSWELQYFSSETGCDAAFDSDGDGMDNLSEYICGTHPRDRMSVFSAVCKSSATGGAVIEWDVMEGRIYNVFESHYLSIQDSFSAIPGDFVFPSNSYTASVGQASGFYKVTVKLAE